MGRSSLFLALALLAPSGAAAGAPLDCEEVLAIVEHAGPEVAEVAMREAGVVEDTSACLAAADAPGSVITLALVLEPPRLDDELAVERLNRENRCRDLPRGLSPSFDRHTEAGFGMSLGVPTGFKIRLASTAPSKLLVGGDFELHTALIYSGATVGIMAGRSFDVRGPRAAWCELEPTSVVRVWGIAGGGAGSIMGLWGGSSPAAYGRVGVGFEWRSRGITGLGAEVGLAFQPEWDKRNIVGLDLPAIPYAQITVLAYTGRMQDR